MKVAFLLQRIRFGAVVVVLLIWSNRTVAQRNISVDALHLLSASYSAAHEADGDSSRKDEGPGRRSIAPVPAAVSSPPVIPTTDVRPFSAVGVDAHVGLGGIGFDVATPLSRKFNLRVGSDFFSYDASFQEQGANVSADLRLRSGHASLDWFPFGGRFRLSPLIVYGNDNRVQATALVPSGSTVTLNGQDYISSSVNPLHGSGSVDFRKVSPGISLGFGNIVPRAKSRFSVPVEVGFYYVGQPGLKVAFTGSACDPTQPPATGCQSVDQDSGFQQNLAAFEARNDNNLSYASFFPVFSIGLGYKF